MEYRYILIWKDFCCFKVGARGAGAAGEARAQAALGAYLAPAANIDARYAPAVHDLARNFFHHLLRYVPYT